MTSPAEPASSDATQARQLTKPLRELAALALLGANAVFLFVGLLRLIAPNGSFTERAGGAFGTFVGLEAVGLPLLAVLLATHISPVVPKAKLITQVALGEYAASAVIGTLTMLISTVGRLADARVLDALLGVLDQIAWMVIFAVAAWVVYTIWRARYYVPRPKPQPGVYGQPQAGWPQQQGGWPSPGQPGGQPQGGWPAPGQYAQPSPPFQAPPSAPSHPQSAPPHPQSAPPFPQSAPPFQAPQSAPPFPQSAPPHQQSAPPFPRSAPPSPAAPPFGQPPSADPTQAIPRPSAEPTQAIPRPSGDPTEAIPRPSAEPTQAIPRPSADPTEAIPRPSADPTEAIPRPSGDLTEAIPRPSADPAQAIPRPANPDDDRTQHIKPGEHPDQPR